MQDEGFCSHGSAQAILFGPGATGCVIAMSVHPFLSLCVLLSHIAPTVWNTQMGLITSKGLGLFNLNPSVFLTPGSQAPAGPLFWPVCSHIHTV